MTSTLGAISLPADVAALRREVEYLRQRISTKAAKAKPAEDVDLSALVRRAGDTMTGTLNVDVDGGGVVVDSIYKRVGLMKYPGFQPAIAVAAGGSFYLGHTDATTVTAANAGSTFAPDVTLRSDGRLHTHQGLVTRWIDSPFAPGVARIDIGQSVTFLIPPSGGHVSVLGTLRATTYAGDAGGAATVLGTGSESLTFGAPGGVFTVYSSGTQVFP